MASGRLRFIRGYLHQRKSRFPFIRGRIRTLREFYFESGGLQLVTLAKRLAILLLPVALAACFGNDDSRPVGFMGDGGAANQAFPGNYRAEELAFMRTYLNNPVGVRDATMAEPVLRDVNGRSRYVGCLRYSSRESDGSYREPRERGVLFVNGRLDRMIENPTELCAGVAYAPFPELEKLTR